MSQQKIEYTCPKCEKEFSSDGVKVFCPHCGINIHEYAEETGKQIRKRTIPVHVDHYVPEGSGEEYLSFINIGRGSSIHYHESTGLREERLERNNGDRHWQDTTSKKISELGLEGWELVDVIPVDLGSVWYFKRPIQERSGQREVEISDEKV